jgi:hypothetical protein
MGCQAKAQGLLFWDKTAKKEIGGSGTATEPGLKNSEQLLAAIWERDV